ncbi:hypothetical protein MesoLjLc_08120 [Mesorhizobium sp. L-8-10]|uniref:DUF3616 domain-containing protein n=1 Tax=Mesorhizobium sp. L-8-10 TaxID=2744523 RepID=UPI00192920EE|nr:DUF3616 domain-containing protein [Mesorhizobium sp. L-8-10]BCH28882.1 hypothetical protein MesoLjLc_08120 [Mesorhizobium sp. L-8-10]
MRLVAVALVVLLPMATARADIVPSGESWTVVPEFAKDDDARLSISGAACVAGHCLAVNDEKKYAQFFDLGHDTIVPTEVIRLLPGTIGGVEMKELDAEGAAYVPATAMDPNGHFYVVGSHGLGRQGALRLSAFFLVRFPVDPHSGRPTFHFDDDTPAAEIQRTDLLRETLKAEFADHAEKPLDENGVTIEGIAFLNGDMLLGLRGPSIDGEAFVMRVAAADLFGTTPPPATVDPLPLGDCVGIRDLAAVSGGVLVLAGRSDDDRNPTCEDPPSPSVWFWTGKPGEAPTALGALPGLGPDDKAEVLLTLQDEGPAYRFLVLFDGKMNGGPMEFSADPP